MALDKTTLKASLKQALIDTLGTTPTSQQSAAFDAVAQKFSDAIDAFVRTASVRVDPGIPVATTGTSLAQTGATTGLGNGTIS